MDPVKDVLEHFGTKGMHWGIRRTQAQLSTSPRPTSLDAAQAHHVRKTVQKHGLNAASNAEIKLLNERIGLESNYYKLFPRKESVIRKGVKMAGKILSSVGEQQAKNYLNKNINAKIEAKLPKTSANAAAKAVAAAAAKAAAATP